MAAEDYIPDSFDFDENLPEEEDVTKTCWKCNKPGLIFGKRGAKWVLEETSGRKHVCKRKDILRKMFEEND